MDHARLARANLNLLVTLDVLLELGSVTRAAQRLGVTVSAVSHSLRALRETFDDPLLVRGRGGLTPTPRALALVGPLRTGLVTLDQALADDPRFDPATSTREVRLATTDYVAVVLSPTLVPALRAAAPRLSLSVLSFPEDALEGMLERGEVDIAIYPSFRDLGLLKRRKLFDDGFACLVREDHPDVGKRLSLARYVALGHALISPQGRGATIVDRALAERGLERHVALRVQSFAAAPLVVASSDLVLTAPSRLARAFARHGGLRVLPPPIPLERFPNHLFWHERFDHDPAHVWLREAIAAAAAQLPRS
ncbi:MAG: LysR family transcriptional regulator [Myxococcales bacterium]|nr:LysR family transcriptional regulator [Myxococcales bacterium]